jgi:hypothetical protein
MRRPLPQAGEVTEFADRLSRLSTTEFENLERSHRYVLLDFRCRPANMARSGRVHDTPQR